MNNTFRDCRSKVNITGFVGDLGTNKQHCKLSQIQLFLRLDGIDNVTLRLWKLSDFCSRNTVGVAGDDVMFHILVYFCIRSLVRHLPNTAEHFDPVFSTCAVRKTKTLGTEWMLVVDWLIFRHGVFPAVKSNRVENVPCHVTRELLLNIIHTHQIKIRQKKLRNLFTPSAIVFVTKFHVFCHHV